MSDDSPMTDLRDRLTLAALEHVPFDGWSDKALRHAAADCGLESRAVDRAFPHGVASAVRHFTQLGDRLMLEDLAALDLDGLPIRERIATAVRTRLGRWGPHQEAVRRAMAVYALPGNMGAAGQGVWTTVDLMWKAIGDRSADISWYSKRASLAAVYMATVLYWLDDQTEESAATWDFLARRVDDVVRAIKTRQDMADRLRRLPNPVSLLSGGLPFGAAAKRRPARPAGLG
jgi:ubiquinone biosynthesis protein COQ9